MSSGADGTDVEDQLGRIQAVTDAALGHLDVEELLVALLDRVLELLAADTAAVLLLDAKAQQLVARAARGIEEEVRQGVRVPVGKGFAGRIAADRRPVVLDRVDETTVWNPILWQKRIRAMLGVPLLSGGEVIGVLHVGTLGDRHFSETDAELLQVVGDRIAGIVHTRLLEADRAAAAALQRSLVPSALPRVPGLEFGARFVPAGEGGVGGDWYDVFSLPNGDVCVVVGDVAGHGLGAAVVMGRLRSTIRAYAMTHESPAEVLALTDAKLQHFEPGEIATAVFARLRPPFDRVTIASAGHLPVALAPLEGATVLVDTATGPPLGALVGADRDEALIDLPSGGVVVFYTDGLIERRGEPVDVGLERLRAAVCAETPERLCQRVMLALVGDYESYDDIAMLALRRPP